MISTCTLLPSLSHLQLGGPNLGPQGQGMRKMAAVTVSFPLRPNKSMAPQVDHLGIKVWGKYTAVPHRLLPDVHATGCLSSQRDCFAHHPQTDVNKRTGGCY